MSKGSIFATEGPLKIVQKGTETLTLATAEVLLNGELIKISQRNKQKPKKCSFVLTNDYLYYISGQSQSPEGITICVKARIGIVWLVASFYTKKAADEVSNEYFVSLQKGMKSVVLQARVFEEYENWVIHLSRLTIQTNFFKKYKVEKLLGEGGCAKVYSVTNKHDGMRYACKKFKKENLAKELDFKALVTEISILRMVRGHPHILELEEVQETDSSVYIVTELLEGDRVVNRKKTYKVSEVLYIAQAVLSALKRLDELSIVHRDLKPGNILLKFKNKPINSNEIKVIDFGISAICNGQAPVYASCGTPGYLAPETLQGSNRHKLSTKIDVFALGVILYNSLTGKKLFVEKDEQASITANLRADVSFNYEAFDCVPAGGKLISQEVAEEYAGSVPRNAAISCGGA